ncbi:hypothetical protein [Geobacter sp. AOG2]|uniref:hypothetical protein n=1 Tax=Geobacter sp. AOG2 TaxID=1566347 RepID=UPI001CC40CC8|nr:hypothetical protein [Geobacter sp. AOG2]
MKKHIWARLAILIVTVSALSGCIWVPYDDGGGRGRGRDSGREREGGHYEEHHGGDEGGRR